MAHNAMDSLSKDRVLPRSWTNILATAEQYEWLSDNTKLNLYADLGLAGKALQEGLYEEAFQSYSELLPVTLIYAEPVSLKEASQEEETVWMQAMKGRQDSAAALAEQCIEKQDYRGATAWYEAMLQEEPESAKAYIGLAHVCLYQGDVIEACETLDAGIAAGCDKEQMLAEKSYITDNMVTRIVGLIKYKVSDGKQTRIYTKKYDEQGRTVEEIDKDDKKTKYIYDERGNMVSVVYPGYACEYVYDEADRLVKEDRPGEVREYSYYENGALKEFTITDKKDGKVVTRRYREDGKPEGEGYEYNEAGILVRVEDRAFNELGFPIYAPDETLKSGVGQSVSYAEGQMRGSRAEWSISYTYDQAGRIIMAADTGDLSRGGFISYEYDNQNRLVHIHQEEDNREDYSPNKLVEPNEVRASFHEGSTVCSWLDYYFTYDAYGRLIECRECKEWGKVFFVKKDVYEYVDDKGWDHIMCPAWVPEIRYENTEEIKKISYEECEPWQRINGAGVILKWMGYLRGIDPKEGLEMASCYEYSGNWRLTKESRGNLYFTSYSVMAVSTIKNIESTLSKVWNLAEDLESVTGQDDIKDIEYDYFENMISYRQDSVIVRYQYEYCFTGEIK